MEFEKIRDVILSQMSAAGGNITKEMITPETDFVTDLGADSLDVFQIITELEEVFEFEFDDSAVDQIRTVGDAAEYIKKVLES
ncbi:MAG: phosphopantetheine-binding protein [Defluviitaleaceae bacterium]|nr:phosphopantetheine-binding protein [Defluviitaleaceae bacterium]